MKVSCLAVGGRVLRDVFVRSPVLPEICVCFLLPLFWGCMDPAPEATSRLSEPLNLQNRLGETHLGNRRHERALAAFRAALAGGEDSVRAYSGLSRTHLGMGDRVRAEEALRRAASLDTSRPEVPFARAELLLDQYLETHRGPTLDAAVAAAQRAVRLDPGSKAGSYTLGTLYSRRGDLDSAEVAYRRALSLDPALAPAYERLGSLYKYSGHSAEAVESYRKLLELRPDHAEAMCELAVFYRADGRTSEALELLEKAAVLDTNLAMAYSNLGQLYLALGREEEAGKALRRFRALAGLAEETAVLLAEAEAHPLDANAHLRLADAFSREGEPERAEPHYLRAIELDGSSSAAYQGLGKVYLGRANYRLAARMLEKAAEIDSGRADLYGQLATAYRRSGDHEKEKQARKKARELSTAGR